VKEWSGVWHRIWRGRHCTELDFNGRLYCSANCRFSSNDYLWLFLLSLMVVSLWADLMEENSFEVFVTRTLASETLIRCRLFQFSFSLIFSKQCILIHFIQFLPTSTHSCHSVHNIFLKTELLHVSDLTVPPSGSIQDINILFNNSSIQQ
jgi:hypothetical protein